MEIGGTVPLQCLWRDSVTLISTLLLTYLPAGLVCATWASFTYEGEIWHGEADLWSNILCQISPSLMQECGFAAPKLSKLKILPVNLSMWDKSLAQFLQSFQYICTFIFCLYMCDLVTFAGCCQAVKFSQNLVALYRGRFVVMQFFYVPQGLPLRTGL